MNTPTSTPERAPTGIDHRASRRAALRRVDLPALHGPGDLTRRKIAGGAAGTASRERDPAAQETSSSPRPSVALETGSERKPGQSTNVFVAAPFKRVGTRSRRRWQRTSSLGSERPHSDRSRPGIVSPCSIARRSARRGCAAERRERAAISSRKAHRPRGTAGPGGDSTRHDGSRQYKPWGRSDGQQAGHGRARRKHRGIPADRRGQRGGMTTIHHPDSGRPVSGPPRVGGLSVPDRWR